MSVMDSPAVRARVAELVAAAPPLTAAQRARLRALLRRDPTERAA